MGEEIMIFCVGVLLGVYIHAWLIGAGIRKFKINLTAPVNIDMNALEKALNDKRINIIYRGELTKEEREFAEQKGFLDKHG